MQTINKNTLLPNLIQEFQQTYKIQNLANPNCLHIHQPLN